MRHLRTLVATALLLTMLAPAALARPIEFDADVHAKVKATVDPDASARATAHVVGRSAHRAAVYVHDSTHRSAEVALRVAAAHPKATVHVEGETMEGNANVDSKTRVTWDWGDGERSRGRHATHHYRHGGHYLVTVTYERAGETWRERRNVEIEEEEDWGAYGRAHGDVWIESYDRHDAPGPSLMLGAGGIGLAALLQRGAMFFRRSAKIA